MTWSHLLNVLWSALASHVGTDEFVAWSIFSALIVNMPVPGSPLNGRTFYEWLYNTLHQFANTGKTVRPTQPAPTAESDHQNK